MVSTSSPQAVARDASYDGHIESLGSLRLRHEVTNEILLIPAPTNDPNDPLNWSRSYKFYLVGITCSTSFALGIISAGPSVAVVQMAIDFFGPPGPTFASSIAKVAYFFSALAILQGPGNLVWVPLAVKYGRRPVLVVSWIITTLCAIWSAVAKTYGSELASRIITGFACGVSESLVPMTIADIFFLHERGTFMVIFTTTLTVGAAFGVLVFGFVVNSHSWRLLYWICTALIGACTLLLVFTLEETCFVRSKPSTTSFDGTIAAAATADSSEKGIGSETKDVSTSPDALGAPPPRRHNFYQKLRLYTGTYTDESLMTLFLRQIVLICLPAVFWATLVTSATIGLIVALSSNYATAFAEVYGFVTWQSGLCFSATAIGAVVAIFFGGAWSDWVADIFTKRNGGLREPEMRLPAIAVSCIIGPLGWLLYGAGIQYHLHWMCPTMGFVLVTFAIVQATNASLVYAIDCYRPIAGEVTVSQFAFKSFFGFLLSFYTNPWVHKSGYLNAFGAMAGIEAAILLGAVPFYFYGKRMRHASWEWAIIRKTVHWNEDREVGE